MVFPMAQRAPLKSVASGANRIASQPSGVAGLEALRQLPRAVSVITLQRGADWFGLTATSVSFLSVEPPTLLLSFDCPSRLSPAAAPRRRSASASSPRLRIVLDVALWLRRVRTISR